MVMLNTSLEYLKTLIKKKVSVKELEDILFNLGFEIDSLKGDEIAIEITPDRPDLLSTHGLARAINVFLFEKPKKYEAKKSEIRVFVDESVNSVRPYTVCSVVRNLKFDEQNLKEIVNFQEKLHETFARKRKKAAIGVYPLEKITPPIYYKAVEPQKIKFVPLDSDKEMNGNEILKKHEKGRKYGELLLGKKLYPIFIDSKNEILSMPPIINSAKLGKVTTKTKDVFIECSGEDIFTLLKTLNLIATTLADFGGNIYSVEVIYPDKKLETPDLKPEEVKINILNVNKILGTNISKEEAINFLERMGYLIEGGKIFAPCYRTDILHEIDIIDDIGRAYGVKNFKPDFPLIATTGGLLKKTKIKNRIRELMIGLGFQEVFTLILSSSEEQFSKMRFESKAIFLQNQIEKSINMLRVSLLPELLKVLKNSQHYRFPQKIFEIAEVILPDEKTETKSIDKTNICALISNSVVNYEEISSVLDSLFSNLHISYKLKEVRDKRFINGRSAKIVINKEEKGTIGEFCPKVLENFNLENPVVGFEVDLSLLLKHPGN